MLNILYLLRNPVPGAIQVSYNLESHYSIARLIENRRFFLIKGSIFKSTIEFHELTYF